MTTEPLESEDSLVDDLIEQNPAFQELLTKSAASLRKPFQPLPAAQPAPTPKNGEGKEAATDS